MAVSLGGHKVWRKLAKKVRRKRIRTLQAIKRDEFLNSDSYIQEQELLYQLEIETINKINTQENEKWLRAEALSLEQWNKLQQHKAILKQQQLEQDAKLKLEWELEQKRKKEEEERLKALEEEMKKKREIFMENLDNFLSGDATDPPAELLVARETRPDCDPCPFFLKTACCRFGDQCSRNHLYPGISNVLLAANFYTHFGLNNANVNEYDTDIMLEYEESETYKDFKEFFYDVLSEFEKFGKIVQFKILAKYEYVKEMVKSSIKIKEIHSSLVWVCNNYEKHLRGNTYVEYTELRCAVAAYRALHTRWYGGKQLSFQFCLINSWKNAICGLQIRKRCPKGRACNFLHVFRNPGNLFSGFNSDFNRNTERPSQTPSRNWRWSESPETDIVARSSERSHSNKNRYSERRESRRRKESESEDYRNSERRRDTESAYYKKSERRREDDSKEYKKSERRRDAESEDYKKNERRKHHSPRRIPYRR